MGLTDVASSTPSCEDQSVEDDPTIISESSVMNRPNARLVAEYLSEKYSIRSNPSTRNSAEWKTANIVREDDCEYETHPARGFYFRKLENPNFRPQTVSFETDGNKPRTQENAPPTTSGNPEDDETVEADVIKTASSQMIQRRMDSMPKEAVYPGRMAGQTSIYPSVRQEKNKWTGDQRWALHYPKWDSELTKKTITTNCGYPGHPGHRVNQRIDSMLIRLKDPGHYIAEHLVKVQVHELVWLTNHLGHPGH